MVTAEKTNSENLVSGNGSREAFISTDIGENLMAAFYLMLEHDDLLSTVFYSRIPPITEFIGWLHRPNSRYLGAFVRHVQPLDADQSRRSDAIPTNGEDKGGAESIQSNRPDAAHTEHASPGRSGIAGRAAGGVELVGMGWLFDIGGCPGGIKADTGFAYLKKIHRTRLPLEFTRMMMAHAFNVVGVDVLYGGTPSFNRGALRLSEALGFQLTPVLPKFGIHDGKPCDVVISYLEKENF